MAYTSPPNGWRTFLVAWGTQSVSAFGSALTFFAINILLTQTLYPLPEQKPQLSAALAAMGLAWTIPSVFGGLLAGAWADRHDRKRTMMAMDFVSGCLSLLLASLVVAQGLQVWMLVAIQFLMSLAGAFHNSAFDTSYAMIVPEEKLPRANGMMQTIWSLAGILSPGVAASIIALPDLARQGVIRGGIGAALGRLTSGAALAMTLDAVTFFIAAITLIFLFIPSPQRSDLRGTDGRARKSFWADIAEGARYIWRRRPLLWLLGTFTVANFTATPMGVFQPLLVKFNLAADWTARGFTFPTALALLGTVASIGGVVGGVVITAWGGLKRRRVYGVVIALIVSGIAQIAFGLSPWLYASAGFIFVVDAMLPMMNAHSQTIWQTQTPRELQGRVFAVRRLIAWIMIPVSTMMAGWAGGAFNPGHVLAVLGGILTVFCIGQLFNPQLLRVEDKAGLDALAAQAKD